MNSSNFRRRPFEGVNPGWLFADFLLVFAMIFVAMAMVGKKPSEKIAIVPPTPTFTPTPTFIPTPTQLPRLDTNPETYNLVINSYGILNNNVADIANFKAQVQQKIPGNKRAGLVIVYVGSPTDADVGMAVNIGKQLNHILEQMGNQQQFVFIETSFHEPITILSESINSISIEVYYFYS